MVINLHGVEVYVELSIAGKILVILNEIESNSDSVNSSGSLNFFRKLPVNQRGLFLAVWLFLI